MANALVSFYGAKTSTIAAELAVLYEAARDLSPAADYLLLATENAVRVFAGDQAIALARRGLRVIEKLPDSPARAGRELRFQILLGVSLTTQKGYSDPEVELANTRTRALCRELGDSPEKFTALHGVHLFLVVRANFPEALEMVRQLEEIAVAQQDPTLQLIAQISYVAPRLHSGDLDGALQATEQSLALYEPAAYAAHPHLEVYGADPRTTISVWLGLALWFSGWPDRSLESMREGVDLARRSRQSFTLTYTFTFNAWLHAYRGEVEETLHCANEALSLAQEHGFGQFMAVATIYRGWALAQMGQTEEAIPAMQHALAAYRGAGGAIAVPTLLALTAEAFAQAGNRDEAIRYVNNALEFGQSTGERCWEADLHRLHGELLLQDPGREDEAERAFLRAVDVARQLGARVLELRALTSLVRMRRDPDRHDDRANLAHALDWFTEGFETPDLRAAHDALDDKSESA